MARGFTLIELLVTLVILGIAVAMVSVNLSQGEDRALRTEAEKIILLLQQARDEAMTRGHRIQFSAHRQGYHFLEPRTAPESPAPDVWQEMRTPPFQPRHLPDGVQLQDRTRPAAGETRIVFSPSGLMLPFHLELIQGPHAVALKGATSGVIRLDTSP